MSFEIVYSPEAVDHLRALSKTQQVLVVDQVDEQEAPDPVVIIKAVGTKRHNELWFGEEKIELL